MRARSLNRLAGYACLIVFNERCTVLSGRVSEVASLEVRMNDVCSAMDAAGSRRATLFGDSVRWFGIDVRWRLHCGECETIGDNGGGIAVHIGARKLRGMPGEWRIFRAVG